MEAVDSSGRGAMRRDPRTFNERLFRRVWRPVVFLLCLLPAALLVNGIVGGQLGANPVEALLHATGDWALRLLLLTLAATPLRRLTAWTWPIRLRRMLGLFTFFYALLHLTVYLWLDRELLWSEILVDLIERPYVTVGFGALVILFPLAVTSTSAMMRRLGKRWKRLHRWVYVAAVLAVVHFWWLVKADVTEPAIHGAILAGLLLLRRFPARR